MGTAHFTKPESSVTYWRPLMCVVIEYFCSLSFQCCIYKTVPVHLSHSRLGIEINVISPTQRQLVQMKMRFSLIVYFIAVGERCCLCFNNVSLMSYWCGKFESVNIFPTLLRCCFVPPLALRTLCRAHDTHVPCGSTDVVCLNRPMNPAGVKKKKKSKKKKPWGVLKGYKSPYWVTEVGQETVKVH